MLTDDEISEILLPLMPLKDPYVFARAVESFVMARGTPVTRKKPCRDDVAGSGLGSGGGSVWNTKSGPITTGCLIYSFRPHTQQPNDAGDSASEHNLALSA